jgi:hypothetical protein
MSVGLRSYLLKTLLSASLVTTMLLPAVTQAASKSDFAYGYSIEVDGDGAIYSLYLDEKVYNGLTREDRGDLRIFNGNGQVVPHDIRRAEKMIRQKQPAIQLPIFPLYKKNQTESITGAGYNVHITTNDQGAIIDLNYGKATTNERVLAAYIIDASSLKQPPEMMTINWNEQHDDFVLTVGVEGSDDLTHWRTVVNKSTLSHLQHGKHTLLQKTVELPGAIPKYLRLSWVGYQPFTIDSIDFEFPETYRGQARNWSGYSPARFDEKQNAYYFNTQSVLPIDRVNFNLPDRNTLVNVLIESAANETGPWYSRYRGLLYNLQYGENILKNPDIHQSVHSHRYWRLTILNGEGKFSAEPTMHLGWIPEKLLFVATGESPFTLAYGSARVGPVAAPLAQLLSESSIKQQGLLIKPAKLGSTIDFGDQSRLEPPRPPLDWKRYLLWAVLILGVAVLAFMAMRLYKQMEEQDEQG